MKNLRSKKIFSMILFVGYGALAASPAMAATIESCSSGAGYAAYTDAEIVDGQSVTVSGKKTDRTVTGNFIRG